MSQVFALILFLLAGCSGTPRPPASGAPPSEMNQKDTLRSTTSSLAFDLSEAGHGSDVIEVVVTAVNNPAKKAVIVDVFLSSQNGDEKLGAFTLYPADRPGSYIFKIPQEKHEVNKPIKVKLVLQNPQWFDASFYLVINSPGWLKR